MKMAATKSKSKKDETELDNQNDEDIFTERSDGTDQLFQLSQRNKALTISSEIDTTWFLLLGLASAVRLYKLSKPSGVVFDEVHYGKFTALLMQGKFFFDVNPPLGKLLVAAAGYVTGYDGSFSFNEIGEEIPASQIQGVLYLRLVPSIFGIFLVPIVYEIVLELSNAYWFAIFGALLVCFENMLIVESRFILLEGLVVFFIAATLCCYVKFLKEYTRPFQWNWWKYLIGLGLSITGCFSVKYCGMLSVYIIGVLIAYEVWFLIGDIKVPVKSLYKHVLARSVFLIAMPILLYIGQFYIMFSVLNKTGPHDGIMSSSFQKTLQGGLESITKNQAEIISYGSQITLRNTHFKQCWLHSHQDFYPVKYADGRGSSAQQQITCYAFKDINNWFIVKDPERDSLQIDFPPRPVKDGDIIHLVHGTSGRGLNSHDVGAPLNPTLMEVSGYVDHNVSMDPQYGWRVELKNPDASGLWKAIGSEVIFVHVNTSASIRVSGEILPDWGYHQYEVGTDRRINIPEAVWNVEEHNQNITKPEGMSDEEAKKILAQHAEGYQLHGKVFEMTFFQKFLEYQRKMFQVDNSLKQEHSFASRPIHWPLMLKGVAYWVDRTSNRQIFCIGNPIVWWLGCLCFLLQCALLLLYLARRKRNFFDLTDREWNSFVIGSYLVIGGYLINYLYYFPVESSLFVHHYLPALLFKIISIPFILAHFHSIVLKKFPIFQILVKCATFLILGAVILSFKVFAPFTYGVTELTSEEINRKKWLSSWNFLSHS